MSRKLLSLAATCMLVLPLTSGCESNRRARLVDGDVTFWVEPSDTSIVAGEIVTFTAHSRDTIGRNAEVKWTSTAGKLDTEENGRIARASFDQPGAYTVTGTLYLDGTAVQEDSIDIEVEKLR